MRAQQSFKSILADYPRRNSADRRHLVDWAQDPRAEEIWQRLNRRKETDAKDFIGRVLTARRNASALMARLTQSKSQREEWHKYYAQRNSDIFAQNHSIADIADELLALAYAMQEAAHVFDAWDSQMLPGILPEAAPIDKMQTIGASKSCVHLNSAVFGACSVERGATLR
jgi:hypothetical protein